MKPKWPFILCLLFLAGCAAVPMQTPNPKNPSVMLPERVMIEGIKIERTQNLADCVPVALETILRFHGKVIPRKEIDDSIHKTWFGTTIQDMREYAQKQDFSVYTICDTTKDKRQIKFFLTQHLPVLVRGKHSPGPSGHVVILVGYDDRKQVFYFAAPESRAIQDMTYVEFEEWHSLGGEYGYVIYPSRQSIEKL